jgi:hypothetical protein
MSLPKDQAWFPTKRYGYGWGLPRRWQGWVVVLLYMAALLAATGLIATRPELFAACVFGLSVVLIAICWWKGEKPRWRWGDDS